ncbi:MAG: PhzF family phenazine biosynthesis protein [Cytophagales bacterium]|nr:PhzF family phenazine biosynthesis protein [Cytophagales bacterium]
MKLDIYQIDAFTDELFRGNPACVIPLDKWLPDEILLKIAQENAVAETAYFIQEKRKIKLRWFTPDIEMDLCGHATLSAAHVIKNEIGYSGTEIIFETLSGELKVAASADLISMNFPSRKPEPAVLPNVIEQALNIQPVQTLKARDYFLVYESADDIERLEIDRPIFDEINVGHGGVIVTAKGDNCDFVSRFFTPQASILEDPVTGSAHCSLIPYWSEILGKKGMSAIQLSARQGKISCQDLGERVGISGNAITYLKGAIWVD